MAQSHSCGSCNMCCFLLAIPDLGKPARMWCEHAGRPHGGCAVHEQKQTDPKLEACATFICLWLNSQYRINPDERMSLDLRPNRCGVMMGPYDPDDPTKLYVHVDPQKPAAFRQPIVAEQLSLFLSRGAKVEMVIGENHFPLEPT